MAALPQSFTTRKASILAALSVPQESYNDLSPKGSIDEGIRELIDEINGVEGFVTTSSCAGRVSVFAEGVKRRSGGEGEDGGLDDGRGDGEVGVRRLAGVGGRGGGGRWLFVAHEPVVGSEGVVGRFGMRLPDGGEAGKAFEGERLVHFKFEPMILHILTASLSHAQLILGAALQAGFRESGALNLTAASTEVATPMVAVRSMGLSLESVIGHVSTGDESICIVSEGYLMSLVAVANERFEENSKRIDRFRVLLKNAAETNEIKDGRKNKDGEAWEDKDARRERKRAEGLKISRALMASARRDEPAHTDEP